MSQSPSGEKTQSSPMLLHAFRTKSPQNGPMHFKW